MQRVLIDCRSLEDSRVLKSYIERELPCQASVSFDLVQTLEMLDQKAVHLLVVQTPQFREAEVERIRLIRETGYAHPILSVANEVDEILAQSTVEKLKAYTLEKPFDMKVLKGLARKLMGSKSVAPQTHRRYRTRQHALIETFISGETFASEMFNLSMGGAYFEMTKRPSVNVGDLLRLKIPMASSLGEHHHIHGRLVWTTPKGAAIGGYGLGIKFIRSNDMYRQLVEKV